METRESAMSGCEMTSSLIEDYCVYAIKAGTYRRTSDKVSSRMGCVALTTRENQAHRSNVFEVATGNPEILMVAF